MYIKTYSYRFAEEILQHENFKEAYDELITICKYCPIPMYEGKSSNQKKLDVVQQLLNTYFSEAFKRKGWKEEPLATPDTSQDALRSDFRKTFNESDEDKSITVQIEVEFGNVASSYRNYFKFQLSYSYGLTDICVLIVPSQHLSNRIDSGVSNFEKVLREIPSAKLSITVPILVIGLFDIDDKDIKIEEWNVRAICEDLKIVKGANKNYVDKHRDLIRRYIDSIPDLKK